MDAVALALAKKYTDAEVADKQDKVPVTVADNGKFMVVDNGVWTAKEVPSANGEDF